MDTIISTSADPQRLVLTREAAKVIGCSMSNMRWLAKTGRLKTWKLGPRSIAFDIADCLQYKRETAAVREAARRAGRRARGAEPQGFSPDRYYGN